MPSAASRLRDRRRHREVFGLAIAEHCSLAEARRRLIDRHLQHRRAAQEHTPKPRFWWEDA